MATHKKSPRPWNIDDLLYLGTKTGATYLKAVPVLLLENWVRGERKEGRANFVKTNDLAERLESSKVGFGFDPKVTAHIGGALTKIQRGRNLTDPPLIEFEAGGIYRINLPYYEALLQEYRQIYRERYPEDYSKLFPDGEPEWEDLNLSKKPEEYEAEKPIRSESKEQGETRNLFAPLEQALQDLKQAVENLTKENQRLRAEANALQAPQRVIIDEELANDCAEFLMREDTYIDAIRRAGVLLEERLKATIGGSGPEKFKHGVDLVDFALRNDSGKLIISEYPAEQEGVRMLFRGAVQFIRNPPSHKKLQYTELEARQAVGLIDYLLSLLQQTRPR